MAAKATKERQPAFDGMTREQLDAMTPDQRQARRLRLYARGGVLTMTQFATTVGLKRPTLNGLRANYLASGVVGAFAMPAPPPSINSEAIRKPGQSGPRGDSPVWRYLDALAWGVWTQRLDEDFVPNPEGRPKPGRPPANRPNVAGGKAVTWDEFLAGIETELAAAAADQAAA